MFTACFGGASSDVPVGLVRTELRLVGRGRDGSERGLRAGTSVRESAVVGAAIASSCADFRAFLHAEDHGEGRIGPGNR